MPECSEQIKLNNALRDKHTQCVMQQTSLKNQLAALQQRKAATAEELHDCQNDRRDMDAKLSLQASVYEKQKAEGQREVDRQQDLVDNLLHQLKVSSIKHNTIFDQSHCMLDQQKHGFCPMGFRDERCA